MARAAEVTADDVVLEIGPGLGVLTRELLSVASRVVCVELDRSLAAALPETLGSPSSLAVVQGDALTVDLGELVQEPFTVVASLPYHVASPLLFRLLFERPSPRRIVAMVQDEVADRIVGKPGSMSFMGMAFSAVATARRVRRVPPGAFFPPPKVQSAVVRLDLHAEPRLPREDLGPFVDFLRAGFGQPRRQLHNSLGQGLGLDVDLARAVLEKAGIDVKRRPADLSLEEWIGLFGAYRSDP